MHSKIERKVASGVVWSLIERFGVQGMQLILGIILARLLMPADFGLVGMISVFFAVSHVLIQGGFSQAYIQKKEVNDADSNTVFYTNIALSLIIYGVLWLLAPAIGNFYEQSALIALTRVMGVIVIINACGAIQIARLTRDVDFKRKTKISLIATILSGACGVAGAYLGFGVWALVLWSVLQAAFLVAGLWVTSNWTPTWQFSISSLKEMFPFGMWILLTGIIRTVFDNIYILTIGKFFPVEQLGFYTKAKQFQRMSADQLSSAVGVVAFPVFAQMQDNKVKLQESMRKFMQHTLFFLVPFLITLIVIARPFVLILLTEKWAPMILYLQLLCIAGMLKPMLQVNLQALKAQGKSKLSFKLSLIKNFLRIANIAIMYKFSITHILIGEVVVSILALVINSHYTHTFVNYGLKKQIRDVWTILFSGSVAGLTGYVSSLWIDNLLLAFSWGSISTLLIYFCIQYRINRSLIINTIVLNNSMFKFS